MEAMAFLLGIVASWQWGYFWADARRQIRENRMNEFRVGDRVRFTDGEMWPDLLGLKGTVVEVPHRGTASVELDRDPWPGRGLPCAWASDIEHVDGE